MTERDVTEILPNLWLGNYKTARDSCFVKKYNIQYIISVIEVCDKKHCGVTYLHFPIKDKSTCNKNLVTMFDVTSDFIKMALYNNAGILVHCKEGHHRSASVVAAFLLKYLNLDYITAIAYIHQRRPNALTRNTCMSKALFKYYIYLNNITNCKIRSSNMGNLNYYKCE